MDAVKVSYDGLCALSMQFTDSKGIGESLCAKLRAAREAAARGTSKAMENQVKAYENEVRAQEGRALTAREAEVLVGLARGM